MLFAKSSKGKQSHQQSLYYIGMTNDILTAHSVPKSNLRLCLTLSLLKNIKVSIGRKQIAD